MREVDEVYIVMFLLKSVAGITAGVQDQGTQAEIQTVCTVKKTPQHFPSYVLSSDAYSRENSQSLPSSYGTGQTCEFGLYNFSNSSQSSNFHRTFHHRFDKDYFAFHSDWWELGIN